MMAWLGANLAPVMFTALALMLVSGVPVVFGLAACGLGFAVLGVALDLMPPALMQALPLRVFGIMSSELLLAIPFFTFMGLVLDKSHLAEDLLETVADVFGPMRGGLALAVVLVGALLAATTGVVAAAVISMGLISLPAMLRHGYSPRLAAGVIAASGSLTQIVPPSLALIVVADQLGRGVGEMYSAALLPAAIIIGAYVLLLLCISVVKPQWMPATPGQVSGASADRPSRGYRSLAWLALVSAVGSSVFMQQYPALLHRMGRDIAPPPPDERVIVGLAVAIAVGFGVACIDRWLRLGWLSRMTQRVAFVLIPPLVLIFLVLGTIYLGVATPTEGGALGAVGAWLFATLRRRLTLQGFFDALLQTAKLSCFVLFILIGSTIFSHTFNAVDGGVWVARLFAHVPGGVTGFLLVVTALTFLLGLFLDFFEIAFVLIPLLSPVATALGIDLVWFGVLIAINLQASFLTPPFGYALFFLRNVAPREPHHDATSGLTLPPVTTADIYLGALPFVAVQLLVMVAIIVWPSLIRLDIGRVPALDDATVLRVLDRFGRDDVPYTTDQAPPDPLQWLKDDLRQRPAPPPNATPLPR